MDQLVATALAEAATPADLAAARIQMAFSLGWHIIIACFGVGMPGLAFTMEGIAFFIEAIFLGIYLYAWDRLPPRTHLLTGIPVLIAGVASAFFVVTANAWMNQPRGFDLVAGEVVN